MPAKKKKKAKLPKQLIEKVIHQDKLDAAAHEAGHLVVAAVQGFDVGGEIRKFGSADPVIENSWGGVVTARGGSSAEVGVAGTVAEKLFKYPGKNLAAYLDMFFVDCDEDRVPVVDIQMLPPTYEEQKAVVTAAYKILRNNWPFLEWARNKLLKDGHMWNHEVDDYCREHKVKRIPHPAAGIGIQLREASEAWHVLPVEKRKPPRAKSGKGVKPKTASRPKAAKKKPKAKPLPTTKAKHRTTK